MEQPQATPPPWLPAARQAVPPPAVPEPSDKGAPDPPTPPTGPRFNWRKLARSPRGAAGLAVLAAALLLWPFSGLSWIPWLAGLGALIILRLLRLDGLLRGWDIPLAGLVVVIGLMWSTGPWAWALAASIGVLLAGLAQLPWWRLAAVGAVMCLVSGFGVGFSSWQEQQQADAAIAQTQEQGRGTQGTPRPNGVLPIVLNRIAQNVPGPICDNLMGESARQTFAAAVGAKDCAAAVATLSSRVTDRLEYTRAVVPSVEHGSTLIVDACAMKWGAGAAAGPQLGKLTVGLKTGGSTYEITGFAPCA